MNAPMEQRLVIVRQINKSLSERDIYRKHNKKSMSDPWLVFLLRNTQYAIPCGHVRRASILYEVIPFVNPTPQRPGVMWDGSGPVSLLDMRSLFGYGDYMSGMDENNGALPQVVVTKADIDGRGLIVDEIVALAYYNRISGHAESDAPETSRYLSGRLANNASNGHAKAVNPAALRVLPDPGGRRIDWNKRVDLSILAGGSQT